MKTRVEIAKIRGDIRALQVRAQEAAVAASARHDRPEASHWGGVSVTCGAILDRLATDRPIGKVWITNLMREASRVAS